MKRLRIVLLLVMVAITLPGAVFAQPPMPPPAAPPVFGTVLSRAQQRPIGGATISLVHRTLGRSSPAFSAPNGAYFFSNVPPSPEPYFIEAYWGSQLLFRSQILYRGGSVRFDIPLP